MIEQHDVVMYTSPQFDDCVVGVVLYRHGLDSVVCRFWDHEYKIWNSETVDAVKGLAKIGSLYSLGMSPVDIVKDMNWNRNHSGAARRSAVWEAF